MALLLRRGEDLEYPLKKHLETLETKTLLAKKHATKAIGLQPFLDAKTRDEDVDFHHLQRQKIAAELCNYEQKSLLVAALLWLTTGFLGGHRYYLDRIGSGFIMAMTGGGLVIWWLIDGFRLAKLVAQFNAVQAQREKDGEPPLGMQFLPSKNLDDLICTPSWLPKQQNSLIKTVAYLADLLLLAFFGIALASMTQSMGLVEPLLAAVMIIFVCLFSQQLMRVSHLPLIHELLHLEFKLRLFYTHHNPGHFFALILRPIYGLFIAPFNRRARYEIRLYMEVSGVFAIFLFLVKLLKILFFDSDGTLSLTTWTSGFAKIFLAIYLISSPIGAVMTKHVLMGTHRIKLFLLGGITLLAILAQFLSQI